jgi:hypothetical protein
MNAPSPVLRVTMLASLMALAACSAIGDTASPSPSPTEEPGMSQPEIDPSSALVTPKPSAPADLGGSTITGTLGFEEIEGGCPYLRTEDGTRYQVTYPEGWQLRQRPLELVSPEGEVVARTGDEVSVRGRVATDMLSICQIGPIFRATEVTIP